MSRVKREENVGEVAVRSGESFWILPRRYIIFTETDLYSPWFLYLGEKWRFIMSPKSDSYKMADFYLWRKFRRDLPCSKYILQMKLKKIDGEEIAFSEKSSKCDYGFHISDFCTRSVLRSASLCDCEQIKIFFVIKEDYHSEVDQSCTAIEKSNENDINKENESFSEDEVSSDEDDDEKTNILLKNRGIKILLNDLKQVFSDGRMTDAVIKVDGREFKVHKVILIARSPVFASMFEHDMAEKKDNMVAIPDCTAEAFEVFLFYLYSGSVTTLSISNVHDVYYAADKYRVDDLKKRCLKLMIDTISVESFCDVISLALRHGESKLQKRATDFFSQNIKKIIKTVQWQKYMVENATHANELLIKALNA